MAASPVRFSGEMGGLVLDAAGKPQPGAIILLFNRQDRLLQQAATDAIGTFSFSDLLPDFYSIRVSLTSFVPAMKERIQIRPGMRSLLEINLSRVFSSVQLVSTTPAPGGLMSDNWKWTLRANNAARPVLRILPATGSDSRLESADESSRPAVFSGSHGLIRISASDGAQMTGDGQADLGTQFAFATSLYGGNHLQIAGNLGYASLSGAPSAGVRTTYSREFAGGVQPEIAVTMRQMFVPFRIGQGVTGNSSAEGALPALRTLGLSFADKAQISDSLRMEYGFELDSVSFFDRLHYFSPYAKLTYSLPHGEADFTWTSGNARPELGMSATDPNADLQRDLAALAILPRVSLENGHAKVQRGEDFEVGFSQRFGSREYRVSGYREDISNTTLTIASAEPGMYPGDLVPDLFSNSALFNLGRLETFGYTMSVTQDLNDNYKVTLVYGSIGALSPKELDIPGSSADDLRRNIEATHRPAVTLRASGTVKCTGTRFVTSYQWTDYRSAMPAPLFSTESARPDPGLNIMIRQPMPAIPGVHGRLEASAELRNLLAQGYLPLATPGGGQFLLVNTPRSFRGGLAFVF